MKRSTVRVPVRATGAACVAALAAVGLTACGSPAEGGSSAGGDGGPVEIEVWTWAQGYDKAAEAFNAAHDDVQVTYTEIEPGAKGGYDKIRNAIKAGSAPCLAQVGYETMPSFASEGNLLDVTEFAAADADAYAPAGWSGVTVGDRVYAAPQDQGPMVLFYNKDVFAEHGIEVPTTWDEYRAAGEKLKEAGVALTGTYEDFDYTGFAWQAGAPWYAVADGQWSITNDSPENQEVAAYWQGLVDDGLVGAGIWSDEWAAGLSDGSIATIAGAAWFKGILKDSAAGAAGRWAVAPLPTWEAGETVTGNVGGSGTAVLAGCENPEAAWEVAHFMSTDPTAVDAVIEGAGILPASVEGLKSDLLTQGDDYFGGQVVDEVAIAASADVAEGWVWGPGVSTLIDTFAADMKKAYDQQGTATVADALTSSRTAAVDGLAKQGITVGE
ncbi:ABC transporter substrate-binding protein [Isoptericola cucumis]|uniref:Sugar ABC transporter substrate-binding protein n=1 Tax=Isoptericola cucumis TaxID=1776856 RepID=A0ABQ2B2M8_9MICO|nr:sugar ABC transporter substrate-binding protein [Isoptericola cucumis]GGI06297.1 sugar ABC transporter substrate-binding protein [Isoptericola cucumis]